MAVLAIFGLSLVQGCVSDTSKNRFEAKVPIKQSSPPIVAQNQFDPAALKQAQVDLDAISWPAAPRLWPFVKDGLISVADNIKAGGQDEKLQSRLRDLRKRIAWDAPNRFLAFDHGGRDFFGAYPVEVNRAAFFKNNARFLVESLSSGGVQKIKDVFSNYAEARDVPELTSALGKIYATDALKRRGALDDEDPLENLIAMAEAKDLGFASGAASGPTLGIAFVEVTSKTLLRHGQIDFPASVDVDLPVEFARADLEEVLSLPKGQSPRYVIVFDVALAKASRRVLGLHKINSTIFGGFETGLKSSRQNAWQGEGEGQQIDISPAKAPEALGIYGNKAVGAPIFYNYAFRKATIQARKIMTVNYYVIDRQKGTYFQSMFDASEEERFNVAYNIHSRDPKKNDHKYAYDTEKDVDEFEKEPVAVKLSKLLRHYGNNRGEWKPLINADNFRKTIMVDKNKALALYESQRYDARPLNDPRFDSVVVIYVGKGSMGSGFYVKSDVVLTNWHVVKNQKIIEMKLYDGRETFGNVLGKDVRLDLALIKVQHRGKPVQFYNQRNLDLGQTVEAIGHPRGFEFSITRGVVSAVRYHHSINLPKGSGDKVLYVQTDAPINNGNSGGPLFLGDYVIGINTWGKPAYLADNLNFSVHYSEILRFLNEHLPGYQASNNKGAP